MLDASALVLFWENKETESLSLGTDFRNIVALIHTFLTPQHLCLRISGIEINERMKEKNIVL